MTMLEQLQIEPETVRELRSQYIHSVEDLLATAAQPNERAALLEDMKWTERGLEALVAKARRILPRRADGKRVGSAL
ncbi:MAG TPA: hypothetical protein VNN80_04900 [Polyangiaceae bacterium]|jgi:hypothetical protein|nr:hypothetical protein [Polyangiaceae bacterium]